MELVSVAVAIVFALVYFLFYAIQIGDPPFFAVLAIGLALMIGTAVQDLRSGKD